MGVRHEEFELPAHPTAVAEARARVWGSLRDWGLTEDLSRTAQLIVSEFFTNAVVHSDSCLVCCRIELLEQRLRIEVRDEGTDCSEVLPREAAGEDVNGRGLQLVGLVAEKWGVRPGKECGRVVWAELALTAL